MYLVIGSMPSPPESGPKIIHGKGAAEEINRGSNYAFFLNLSYSYLPDRILKQIANLSRTNMIFSRLIFLMIPFITNCSSQNEGKHIFEGHTVDKSEIFDSFRVTIQSEENNMRYKISGSSYIESDSFSIVEHDSRLLLETSSCSEEVTSIHLVHYKENINRCRSIYPFFLESITLLDTREISVSGRSYQVFKLSNEAISESSGTYWLKGFGVILIVLGNGRYYTLKQVKDVAVNFPWEAVLSQVIEDKNFSELWSIPPAPPPPPLKN